MPCFGCNEISWLASTIRLFSESIPLYWRIRNRHYALPYLFASNYLIHSYAVANTSVLDFVPHRAVICVVPGTMEWYQVDHPLLICIGVARCYPSLRLDLADDVSEAYFINPCCTPNLCDKPLLTIIPLLSNINISHLDLDWVRFGAAYPNL